MNIYEKLAMAIKAARIAHGMSQEEFAEKLDVSSTHVKHMESGHRKPSVDILFKIVELTGMSVDEVISNNTKIENKTDVSLMSILSLCSEKEKQLVLKITEDIIANRDA
ncbi:MAG: helix-turn-helix transcriptional regulator [Acutalibacteraceae bacterium]